MLANTKIGRPTTGMGRHEREILTYLHERQTYYPPTIREIAAATEISSTSVVNYYLGRLEKWGFIQREARIARSLRITPEGVKRLGLHVASVCPTCGRAYGPSDIARKPERPRLSKTAPPVAV